MGSDDGADQCHVHADIRSSDFTLEDFVSVEHREVREGVDVR